MAVGVVIGGSFGKIVSSLVADIITPLISLATGSLNFTDLKWVFKEAVMEAGEVVTPEVAMTYGNFLQTVIDFLIIALSIFIVLRIIMNAEKKLASLKKAEEEKVEEAPAEPEDTEVTLLKEIRDMLKNQKGE
jgi:large conductance mechanosensitive channel